MAFKMVPVESLWTTVIIETPQDHGKILKEQIEVEYRKLPRSELQDLSSKPIPVNPYEGKEDSELTVSEIEERDSFAARVREEDYRFMKDNIIDIKGLVDEDDNPVEYTDEVLRQLMEMAYAASALIVNFWTTQTGKGKQKIKN